MSEEKESPKKATGQGYVDWDDVAKPVKKYQPKDGDKKRLPYMKLVEGEKHRLRLVGKVWKFKRHYRPIMAISPGIEQDVCWQAGNDPSDRYIIHVIDRDDDNQLKLLEGGSLLFGEFKSYSTLTGRNPSGAEAPDFIIQHEVPTKTNDKGKKYKDFRGTKYHSMNTDAKPFTAEEIAYIDAHVLILEEVKKPHDPEMIAEMFEDSKTRDEHDPIPGHKDWWNNRRDKRTSNDSGGDTPAAPAKASPTPSIPGVDAAPPSETFGELFEDDSSADSSDF